MPGGRPGSATSASGTSRHHTPAPAGPAPGAAPAAACAAPHTYHHDDAAHTHARRRYEGLRAKAASTSYPHEADACHAKADALRDKYGL